jgi:hypothetical protein
MATDAALGVSGGTASVRGAVAAAGTEQTALLHRYSMKARCNAVKEKQVKKPLAHEQGGFNPAVPKKPRHKTQVGPLPTDDPNHKAPDRKSEGVHPKSSKQRPEWIMPRKYSKSASEDVKSALHKRKRGTLKSGRSGKTVKSRKQAIAIGLSEAREKGKKVPKKKTK